GDAPDAAGIAELREPDVAIGTGGDAERAAVLGEAVRELGDGAARGGAPDAAGVVHLGGPEIAVGTGRDGGHSAGGCEVVAELAGRAAGRDPPDLRRLRLLRRVRSLGEPEVAVGTVGDAVRAVVRREPARELCDLSDRVAGADRERAPQDGECNH